MASDEPLRVAVMDDDFYALMGKVLLIMRDVRTTVVHWCETPAALVRGVQNASRPLDAVVVDVEYEAPMPLAALLDGLQAAAPDAALLCLSQYGEADRLRTAIAAGARGFLLKEEVRLAIATAVWRACHADFVVSPGVESLMAGAFDELLRRADRLPAWEIHPELERRRHFANVAWLALVFGMSAPMIAEEFSLAPQTVETYRRELYSILGDGWYEYDDLTEHPEFGEAAEKEESTLKAEEWAYHVLTQFPRRGGVSPSR